LSEPPPLPSAPVVDVTYTLTLEDLREALKPAPTEEQRKLRDKRLAKQAGLAGAPKTPSNAARFGKGMFGWFLFTGLAVMLYLLLDKNKAAPSRAPADDGSSHIDLWLSVIPSALGAAGAGAFILTITLFSYLAKRRQRTQAPPDSSAAAVMKVGLMVSMGLVGLALWVMIHPPFEIAWRPERFEVAVASAVPWAVVFVMMGVLIHLSARRGTQTMYDTNPGFRRQHALHMDANGIGGDDGVKKVLYRWPAFTQAWETDNLLVLDDEARHRHMIPKHALTEAGQLEAARALIVSHVPIHDLFFTPGAFPVNRAPAAPIPAIPLTPRGTNDGARF
jgi:YcxB-like protein